MCTLTKDIHFLCPSKPCVCDNTKGICGLKSMRPDTSCPAEATPRSQVELTQAEIIGNRWLVDTPARTATLTYDQHDTATRISLPNQTLWITVPKGSILHIDELALYHLTDDEYQAEFEIFYWFDTGWHSFRSYRSPSALRRANYSVLVCCRHSALYLYYRRICCDFDTGLPPTQASERRSRVSQQMHVRRPAPFSDVVNPTKNPNLRIWPTWLRSCLYRLVEPLTIEPVKTTQLSIIPNNAFLCLKFLTCSFPNYHAPGFSQW